MKGGEATGMEEGGASHSLHTSNRSILEDPAPMRLSVRSNGRLELMDIQHDSNQSLTLRIPLSKNPGNNVKKVFKWTYLRAAPPLCAFFVLLLTVYYARGRLSLSSYGGGDPIQTWNKDGEAEESAEPSYGFANKSAFGKESRMEGISLSFHFLVHGGCSYQELKSALDPILSIPQDGDHMDLTLVVNCTMNISQINNIQRFAGNLRFFRGQPETNLDVLEYWQPSSDKEILFIVSSSSVLSPDFFPILKRTVFTVIHSQQKSDPELNDQKQWFNRNKSTISSLDAKQQELHPGEYGSRSEAYIGLSFDPATIFNDLGFRERNSRNDFRSPFLSQHLADTCQVIFSGVWRAFLTWKKICRSEMERNNQSLSTDALNFSSQCSTDFKRQLSTFFLEMNIFNLHTNYDMNEVSFCKSISPSAQFYREQHAKLLQTWIPVFSTLPEYFHTSLSNLQHLPRYDSCHEEIKKSELATSTSQLEGLLKNIHIQKSIICIMVSPSFHEMTLNWLCYIKDLGISNLLFITRSKSQAAELLSLGYHVYFAEGSQLDESFDSESLSYGDLNYKKFIYTRTEVIGELLRLGYKILLADVDQVWLSNPFIHLQDSDVDMFAAQELYEFCGGFLYLIPTEKMIALWDNTTRTYHDHIEEISHHPSRTNQTAYEEYLYSQRNVHEQWYLTQSLNRNDFGVKFKGLDRMLFVNGNDYFDEKKLVNASVTPVMIHNNYIVGRDYKIQRFKENGMWRLNSKGSCMCLNKQCNLELTHSAPNLN